jgi:hypothetical protein
MGIGVWRYKEHLFGKISNFQGENGWRVTRSEELGINESRVEVLHRKIKNKAFTTAYMS